MLKEWRPSMPCRPSEERFWSCPTCAEGHQDPKPTTTDTAESASQEVDDLKLEVQQLKAEVERLKEHKEVLRIALKDKYTRPPPPPPPPFGQAIVVSFTDDEAREMRDNAERTRELAQQILYNKTDMCGPCSNQGFLADLMEDEGLEIIALSSRLLELWGQRWRASSRDV